MLNTTGDHSRACRILVVEDDSDDVLLPKRALQAVAKRRSLPLAIQHSCNGFESLCQIGRGDQMTTSAEPVIHDAAMRAGVDRVFAKPDGFPELLDIAKQVVATAVSAGRGLA